jgi:BCD family chlorophyll transporter-like MFS transporter
VAFAAVMFAAPAESGILFGAGVTLIGLGGGLFAHGTLTASMAQARVEDRGLALGAWGAAQASAAGVAIALSGVAHDAVSSLAVQGAFGAGLADPAVGYSFVYGVEILLLFATLVAIGPLVRSNGYHWPQPHGLGLAVKTPIKTGAMR